MKDLKEINLEKLDVATFKQVTAGKGYYRSGLKKLFWLLQNHKEDEKIKAYRDSKTAENPKGDSLLKRSILAFMPSGDYGSGIQRSTKNKLQRSTNLVQLDFDQPISWIKLKKLFNTYDWITVAGISCGGKGFYLLVYTPDAAGYNEYFQALANFLLTVGYQADQAVSSINEIRYLSLTTEVLIRKNPSTWTEKAEKPKSQYDGQSLPFDGKLLKPKDNTPMHYVDLISLVGTNNINGVPLEEVCNFFRPEMFDKSSHIYGKTQEYLNSIIEHLYSSYREQHGTVVMSTNIEEDIELPEVKIDKDSGYDLRASVIVHNILSKYLIKTDANTKETYRFNGSYWELIPKHKLRSFLTNCTIISRGHNAAIATSTRFRDTLEAQIKDVTSDSFNVPLNKFNLANGVLEFANGEVKFTEHSDKNLFTYCIDFEYDPEAMPGEVLTNFLARTIPDAASLETFFQYLGSCFITDLKLEIFLIILGSGANGKSTLLDLIRNTFGTMAVGAFSLDRLTDPDGDVSPKEARNIYNKIICLGAEDSKIKDTRIWRKIVSKESLSIKSVYKDAFETTNYARLISCMNETPYLDAIHGTVRRMVVVKTGPSLRPEEYDVRLGEKLLDERAAFLNLVIAGYKQVHANGGIHISQEAIEVTKSIIDDNDVIISFLRDHNYTGVTPNPITRRGEDLLGAYKDWAAREYPQARIIRIDCKELYNKFKDWCDDSGNKRPLVRRNFLKRLFEVDGTRLPSGYSFTKRRDKMTGIEYLYVMEYIHEN